MKSDRDTTDDFHEEEEEERVECWMVNVDRPGRVTDKVDEDNGDE